jgi:hypothetical protein
VSIGLGIVRRTDNISCLSFSILLFFLLSLQVILFQIPRYVVVVPLDGQKGGKAEDSKAKKARGNKVDGVTLLQP